MKKAQFSTLIILMLCLLAGLTGCMQDPPEESAIMEDMQVYIDEYEADLIVTEVRIVKRQTNEDEKEDNVFCQVVTQDELMEYYRAYYLQYNYYDDNKEWILDVVEPIDKNEWVVRPLVGVSDEMIAEEIEYNCDTMTNNNFHALSNYSIVNRETDLENGVDIVTVKIAEKSGFLEINGTVDLTFNFPEYSDYWRLGKIVQNEDYQEKWDIEGQYTCYDYRVKNMIIRGSLDIQLDIDSVSNKDVSATLSAKFYNRDGEVIESIDNLEMSGNILTDWQSIRYKRQAYAHDYNLELFGGDYVLLIGMNPEVEPQVDLLIGLYNDGDYDFETLITERIYEMSEVE